MGRPAITMPPPPVPVALLPARTATVGGGIVIAGRPILRLLRRLVLQLLLQELPVLLVVSAHRVRLHYVFSVLAISVRVRGATREVASVEP